MAYPIIAFQPPNMPSFPITITWNEGEPLPEGITFIKRDPAGHPMKIEVKVESAVKFYMTKTNIKRCEIDIESLMEFCKFTQDQINSAVQWVRTYVNRIDIVVSDTGVNEYLIALPDAWLDRFRDVLVNNEHIDFEITPEGLEFTVTHGSPEETISIILQSTTTEATATTMNMLVTIVVLFLIIQLLRQVMVMMRR